MVVVAAVGLLAGHNFQNKQTEMESQESRLGWWFNPSLLNLKVVVINIMDICRKSVCSLLLCALFTGVTQAQFSNSGKQMRNIVGEMGNSVEQAPGFYGDVALSAAFDDNILRSNTNEIDDQIVTLAPAVNHRSLFSKHSLDVGYQGSYAFYSDNDNENADNHSLAAILALDFTGKLDVNLAGNYQWMYEPRGATGANLAIADQPNEWERSRLFAEVIYGRKTNQGQLAFSVESAGLEFTNNNQQARDRDLLNFSGTFYYNMTGETSWLFEARLTDIDYINTAAVNRDSQEQGYLVGARWEATRLTRGEVRVGYVNKDFDQTGLNNFDGMVVEAEISWTPLATDQIVLIAYRTPRESTQATASYFISTSVGVSWSHTLTPLWDFLVGASVQEDDYSDERNDDLFFASVGMNYSLSERLSLTGMYQYNERDSNTDGAVYENNKFMITLTLQPGVNK